MQLLKPTPAMKDAFLDYVKEWEELGETVAPGAARMEGRTYEAWLEDILLLETQPTDRYVTSDTYFWMDTPGRLIGVISLRHTLNDFLLRAGGHIGYGVRPSMRRRGHASAMLAAVLPRAGKLGLARVLVSCYKENIASARTIQKNGGVLENEIEEDGRTVQRYWIEL
jgi:predicted acetyltransferase